MYRMLLNSRILVACVAVGSALVGCDAQSAAILANIAKQAREAGQQAEAQMADARTAEHSNEGGSQHSNRPNTWNVPQGADFRPLIDAQRSDFLLQNNPWFGGGQGGQPHCENGKCHEEPRCYPGSKQDFEAEKLAVSERLLADRDVLDGKWYCASGQGYLKLALQPGGDVEGTIVFTGSGHEEPMMAFDHGRFESGRLNLGGMIDGLVGQASESAPFEYLASVREPQGERLVRFTREAR